MKRPSFLQGVVVAALLAGLASVLVGGLLPFVSAASVFRLVIPALGFAYTVYLLSRSPHALGRVTTLTSWFVIAGAAWWFAPPVMLYLLIHVGLIWLVRVLYFYSGMIPALMDLGLSAVSVTALTWSVTRSGSVLLATWCFFLVQALFVAIPKTIAREPAIDSTHNNERFERAHRQADAALRQLFSQ